MEYLTLYNGVKIPQLGFGVFQIPEYTKAKKAVLSALKVGYRLIDTAQAYGNEQAVGDAIRESGIPREEIFITSKIWISDFSFERAQDATRRSLERLGTDFIDLMLLHQPMGDYIGAWRGLEKLYKEGTKRFQSSGVILLTPMEWIFPSDFASSSAFHAPGTSP